MTDSSTGSGPAPGGRPTVASMTGFGIARGRLDIGPPPDDASDAVEGPDIEVTIRTVNHRYLKSSIRLPEMLQPWERDVEGALRKGLRRGSVLCTIRLRGSGAESAGRVDMNRARDLLDQLMGLAREHGIDFPDVGTLAMLPGVIVPDADIEMDEEAVRASLTRVVSEAVAATVEMRKTEGAALVADMTPRLQFIRNKSLSIGERSPQVTREYQQKLHERINELLADSGRNVAEDDLAREVAMFADRSDVTEEVTRLTHHVDQFTAALSGTRAEVGRQLDFIAQEMLREANTMGSKCNDAQISSTVIEIKAEIEKIKEQVQNIE